MKDCNYEFSSLSFVHMNCLEDVWVSKDWNAQLSGQTSGYFTEPGLLIIKIHGQKPCQGLTIANLHSRKGCSEKCFLLNEEELSQQPSKTGEWTVYLKCFLHLTKFWWLKKCSVPASSHCSAWFLTEYSRGTSVQHSSFWLFWNIAPLSLKLIPSTWMNLLYNLTFKSTVQTLLCSTEELFCLMGNPSSWKQNFQSQGSAWATGNEAMPPTAQCVLQTLQDIASFLTAPAQSIF